MNPISCNLNQSDLFDYNSRFRVLSFRYQLLLVYFNLLVSKILSKMALSPEPGTGGFSSDAILDRYRPMSNTKTTYGYMNSWTNLRDVPSGVPQTIADTNYKNAQKDDHDVLYNKTYADLTSKIAYRHPNPGVPRQRQGRIGGSWRHIKEVLGHGGSRVVYVDGLISVYDKENFNQHLNAQLPFRPHLKKTLYSPTRHDYTQTTYNPWEDCEGKVGKFPPVAASDPDLQRKLNIQSASKYKGFYHYNKN